MQSKSWTREEFIEEFGEFKTLKEAITAVESEVSGDGSVVCRVRVNNILLGESDEIRLGTASFNELQSFAVDVDEQSHLIDDVRASIIDYISRVKKASIDTSEKFRSEDLKTAHQMFSSVIDAMSCVWDVLSDIRIVESKGREGEDRANAWIELEKDFLKLTNEITEAYQAEDFFLVSDLLEYEFPNQLDIWAAKVKS